MKTIFILSTLLLVGCSTTVPVVVKFPEPPKYVEKCPELKKLNADAKLSDIADVVTSNYSTYYECALKNDAWNEWYLTQKRIFESVK